MIRIEGNIMGANRLGSMSTDKLVFLIIGGFTVIILVFIFLFSLQESKQAQGNTNIFSYSVTDQDRPNIKFSSKFSDLGKMKVNDEKKADFILENTGNKPLSIFKVSSSCDCTYGQITIEGNKSPEFSMHSKNPWVGTVEPGKSATLSVIYRPFVMPVKGVVTRDVFMQTNDPANSKLTFTIKAIVE